MTATQIKLEFLKGEIAKLPIDQEDACQELAEHFRNLIKTAGFPVGILALALVVAEREVADWEC